MIELIIIICIILVGTFIYYHTFYTREKFYRDYMSRKKIARTHKICVYIASPYSLPEGEQLENAYKSFDAYYDLIKAGFIPFAPLTCHFIHERHPLPYEKWIEIDNEWQDKCDCLLRLPGEGKGADREVDRMGLFGKPVFYCIEDLIKFYDNYSVSSRNDRTICE
jgi:hypothetical protein